MPNEPLAVQWGTNVRLARTKLNATQKQLADECHVAQHTISRIETGVHRPNDALKFALADALGQPIGELFPFSSVPETTTKRRKQNGSIGGLVRASLYDGRTVTQKARDEAFEHWVKQVDPEGALPRDEQVRRAVAARRAHMKRIASKSHEARRRNKNASV